MDSSDAGLLRVLLIDEEPAFRDAVRGAFEERVPGGRLTTTGMTDPDEVREFVATEAVDCVLCGVPLDGVDVCSLIERLRDLDSRLPIVLLVDDACDRDRLITDAAGVNVTDYFPRITTPSQYEIIAERVRDVVGDRPEQRPYHEVFENVTDGLVIHDPDTGEILDVNQRYCEMNGYRRDELIGSDVETVSPDDSHHTDDEAQRLIRKARDEGPQLFEWRNQTKDGHTFPVEVHLAVIELDGTERVLASVRDISDRKDRERDLREAEERFRLVTEHIDEVIFISRGFVSRSEVYDDPPEDREIEYLSPAFEDLFGVPVESVYEDPSVIEESIHPADRDRYRAETARMIEEVERGDARDAYESDYRIQFDSGDVGWVHATDYPVPTDGGTHRWIGILKDVTQRKRRERIVRTLHDAAERIQDARTAEDVCKTVVEAARDVLDLPMTACWFYDESARTLEPMDGTEPVWERGLLDHGFTPGDFEYEVFLDGETTVHDLGTRRPENPLDVGLLFPIGEHALLGAGAPGVDEYEDFIVDAGRILVGHAATALDRVARAEELRESEQTYREIFHNVGDAISIHDAETGAILDGNERMVELFDLDRTDPSEISLGEYSVSEEGYTGERAREIITRVAESGDSERHEWLIETHTGERRWIDAEVTPATIRGERRVLGLFRDITDEKRREETLETLHEATSQLTEASSREEASRIAVEAAEDVLDFPLVNVHLHDDTVGELRPVAATEALEDRVEELPAFHPGDNLPWQVFVEGESVRRSEHADSASIYGDEIPDPDLLLPLGRHGIMFVGQRDDESDAEMVELAQILAATVEASLNHAQGERELERRQQELEEQMERAERLDRLNTILRETEQATIEKSTREEVERAVCDRLTDVEPYELAWIGEIDVDAGAVTVHASAGAGGHVEHLEARSESAHSHPAIEATATETARTVRRIASDGPHTAWQKRALRRGYQSIIAVPLRYEDTTHGVLTIAASDPLAFEERERAVLEDIGRSIGYELTALERKLALESDSTTELEFRVEDSELFFVSISAQTTGRIELERTIRRPNGTFSAFYTVEGVPPAEAVGLTTQLSFVTDADVVSRDETAGLIEVESDSWFGSFFTEHGAVIRTAWAKNGRGRLAVEVPRAVDTRTLVETFQDRYPNTELLAKRERERAVRTLLELQDALEDQLTDRQLEALETAYSAGYFEWPRDSSGEEIAALLDITQPTFNKHLRTAERKAFMMLLDREYPE